MARSIEKSSKLLFPIDKKTEMYVKFAKVMVIYQGSFTDDRTQIMQKVKEKLTYASRIISDESYLEQTGRAICTYDTTMEYFDYFKNQAIKALEDGHNLLVLNPSYSCLKQNAFYLALANKMQYVVLVMPPFINQQIPANWPNQCQAKSFEKYKVTIKPTNMFHHLFCGWFLHDIDSKDLRYGTSLYLQDCIENIKEFDNYFYHQCSTRSETNSSEREEETIDLMRKHFNLDDQWQDVCYCPLKIFKNILDTEYFNEKDVMANYGKVSRLQIVGFIISPHTIAARVKLTHPQKNLWGQESDELDIDAPESSVRPGPCSLIQEAKKLFPQVNCNNICSKSRPTFEPADIKIHEPLTYIHNHAKGRSCHIVVATGKNLYPHFVDNDVKFALHRERRDGDKEEVEDLDRCLVKRIGRYWYIYLKEVLSVDGFMSSYCQACDFEKPLVQKKKGAM